MLNRAESARMSPVSKPAGGSHGGPEALLRSLDVEESPVGDRPPRTPGTESVSGGAQGDLVRPSPTDASRQPESLGDRASSQPASQALDCRHWNTSEYLQCATPADVAGCLKQRAGLEVDLSGAAMYSGDPEVIQALIDAGAKPDLWDRELLGTPLQLAARFNGNASIVRVLVENGANPNRRGGVESSASHRAARHNNAEVVRVLVELGADIDRKGWMNENPLHEAAKHNTPEVVQTLVDAGANLEARDGRGLTALHYATEENDSPAVRETLIAAGAGKTERAKAAAREQSRRGANRGWGALVAGATAATVGAATGLGAEEALEVGTSVAGSVLTRQASSTGGGSLEPDSSGSAGGEGACLIPGYPRPPSGVANLGFPWCQASVSMQVRAFALLAAGAQCAISTGSSSTPEQTQARLREIQAACGRLAALGTRNCRCPPGLGP